MARWTTDDFESLSWHDCHVHGFRFGPLNEECGSADLLFDIDFIEQWQCGDDGVCRFVLAPATLTFHAATELRLDIDFEAIQAGMAPFSLDGIEREQVQYTPRHSSYRWRLPVNWPSGEITFESPGFTQVRRGETRVTTNQCLSAAERVD
ncbi:MAG: hypothetical protein AAF750_18230 [Planctomycetota bacterium]